MASMAVELLLKLIDELSKPMGQATDSVGKFDRVVGESKSKSKDLFADHGRSIEEYQKKLDGLTDRMAKISQIQSGIAGAHQTFEALGKPLAEATKQAIEFEKRVESIARGGGRLDLKDRIGKDILDVSKKANVPWEQIAAGERHLVSLGGGEWLDKIAPVRERLNRLAYAAEAKPETLYSLLERYMNPKVGDMSAQKAMAALEVNYDQGKRGSYELKDMARGLPELLGIGRSYGMDGYQAATDLPAILQQLRQLTGSAGEADTRLRHGLTKLTSPSEAGKIKEELGIDVFEERRRAIAEGRNPFLAVADAIADKLQASGAGRVDEKAGAIVGADPEKLGAIARDFYFRSFLDAYAKSREGLKEFSPAPDDARRKVDEDFASRVATTAGALERLTIAADLAAVKAGETQLETAKSRADRKTKLYDAAGSLADKAPGVTSAGLSLWNTITNAGSLFTSGLDMAGKGALLYLSAQGLATKYPALGAIGENALGAAKGVVKAPWDIAKGLGQGIAEEAPGAAAFGRGMLQAAGRGLLLAPLQMAGEYGVHKLTDALPQAGRNSEIERFANLSLFGKVGDLLSGLFNAAVPAARAETRAPPPPAAMPAAETQQAQPQVDTTQLDQAKQKATEAGLQIKTSLDVTAAPQVDTASIDAALAKVQQLGSALAAIGAQARATAASIARGSGALHDGFETR